MSKTTNSCNPRRIPRSQADVNRAEERGKEMGTKGALAIMLYTLHDKFGADDAQLCEFADAFNYTLDGLAKGYVKVKDLESVLKNEYGTTIEVRDER